MNKEPSLSDSMLSAHAYRFLELRRLFSEVLGTFFLVLVAAGGDVVNTATHGAISQVALVIAPGLMVMAIILFMGKVSGAHLNPAVTIAFAARGDFPWRRVPGYILAQIVGAVIACSFLALIFGVIGSFGSTQPGTGFTSLQAVLVEFVLTLGLISVILGTASQAQNVGPVCPCSGRLYCLGWTLGSGYIRRINEPSALFCPRSFSS